MRISVFGIGYVGAVSAACLAADGHDVIAVDTNPQKAKMINDGVAPIVETGLAELIREGVRSGKLRATTNPVEAVAGSDCSLVCVGTPSHGNGNLDLTQVARVCESIGAALAKKSDFHAVIIRSTMLPGSMRDVVQPALEKGSGRRVDADFGLAIFPEFLREGSAIRDYREAGTVIIGVSEPRTERSQRRDETRARDTSQGDDLHGSPQAEGRHQARPHLERRGHDVRSGKDEEEVRGRLRPLAQRNGTQVDGLHRSARKKAVRT